MRLIFVVLMLGIISCNEHEVSDIEVIKFNMRIIDSLRSVSDTSFTELTGRSDFFTTEYYINRRDTTQTKIYKDSAGNVVGIIKSKHDIRHFSAEYYPNGQLRGKTDFSHGKVDGPATYYYQNGRIKSVGKWADYKKVGIWKEYSESGALKVVIHYDNNGQMIKTEKKSN